MSVRRLTPTHHSAEEMNALHEQAKNADALETERVKYAGGLALLRHVNGKGPINVSTGPYLATKADKMDWEDAHWQHDLQRINRKAPTEHKTTPAARNLHGASELALAASAADPALINGQMLAVAETIANQKVAEIDTQLEQVYAEQPGQNQKAS